ncbi:MAG: 1-acyl-sn-glycerol-3-phosphate acyltransferase [Deltaproteobacteria bacterium]|nr:1-acyl-sn-glycerol-3-phosphate acyltransferase [Deltaproteobacteria bacterium]
MSGPERIRDLPRGLLVLALLPANLIFWSAAALVYSFCGASPRAANRCYRDFSRSSLFVAGTDVERHGIENLAAGQAYVVVSNHESNWDPPTIMASLPDLVIRFVMKTQLLKIPVFGPALRRTGNIPVERTRTGGDVKRLQEGMSERDPEVSILFFAEGNRSRDGSFGPFKMGAFATALDFGLPILPVAVAGTFPIWRPDTIWVRRGSVALEIGAPIPVEGLGTEDRALLRERTHAAVGELRRRARARLRARGIDPGGID